MDNDKYDLYNCNENNTNDDPGFRAIIIFVFLAIDVGLILRTTGSKLSKLSK